MEKTEIKIEGKGLEIDCKGQGFYIDMKENYSIIHIEIDENTKAFNKDCVIFDPKIKQSKNVKFVYNPSS
jgi:hypothetical protein